MFQRTHLMILVAVLLGLAAVMTGAVVLAWTILGRQRRNARLAGYGSLGAYLRAAPRTDAEKRDAVDLALKGVVLCLLGLLFAPLLLIGLVPLFYGTRKVVYGSMGLGIVDDTDQPVV